MKKYDINKIWKAIKYIFINLIVYGIIIGVICGLIVTFLFNAPIISLISVNVIANDNKVNIECNYENKGSSPAHNLTHIVKYVILYKDVVKPDSILDQKIEKFEVGDIIQKRITIDYLETEKDIFENSQIIIMHKVKYEDSCKLRNFINKILLNYQYSIYRLGFYDVSKKGKGLSLLSIEKREKYKEIIDEWTNE